MARLSHGDGLRSLQERSMDIRQFWTRVSRIERRTADKTILSPRATKTCVTNEDSDTCQLPQDSSSNSLPMILGIVIPIILCLIVCYFLHRKYLKRQSREDNDKHKSLDFGLEVSRMAGKGRKGKKPEMSLRAGKGMSMDVGLDSPYILPDVLRGSRESLHSLSRSMKDEYDPYRPVVMAAESMSVRAPSRLRDDGASIRTGNTAYSASSMATDSRAPLVRNASPMSFSKPTLSPDTAMAHNKHTLSPPLSSNSSATVVPLSRAPSHAASIPPPPPPASDKPATRKQELEHHVPAEKSTLDASAAYQAPHADDQGTVPSIEVAALPPRTALNQQNQHTLQSPPRKPVPIQKDISVPSIALPADGSHHNQQNSEDDHFDAYDYYDEHELDQSLQVQQPATNQRLSMSVRPLPPTEPGEDAETRANRIRSFYKEYFDDSKPNPSDMRVPPMPGQGDYHEDFDSDYLADGTIFDPETGQFIVAGGHREYAEPITRRAMTPPPRAPPRFRSNMNGSRMHSPNLSVHSTGTYALPPRGMSAMSHRGYGRGPRRPMEPPKPLRNIPTPGMMKDDTNLIFDSTDFAPPVSYRDRQAGRRPGSPYGGQRPYSPSVRPFTPLQGSYDDLSVMPSPHMLRKSSTFTGLDFAPPSRLRTTDNFSDSMSMRSGRSGMSQAQAYNIRAGAYRVSRIPRELAGTKNEIAASLRPTMNMTRGV